MGWSEEESFLNGLAYAVLARRRLKKAVRGGAHKPYAARRGGAAPPRKQAKTVGLLLSKVPLGRPQLLISLLLLQVHKRSASKAQAGLLRMRTRDAPFCAKCCGRVRSSPDL